MDSYYIQGFRTVAITAQSVTTSIQTRNNGEAYHGLNRDLYGEIIVIMEK